MFKVSNKDTGLTSLTSSCSLYCSLSTGFTYCSGVSSVEFKHSYFLLVAFLCFQIKTLHSSICFILWFHDGLQMSDIYQKGNTLQLIVCQVFNPLHLIGLFLYPLKTSVNLWFSGVFREYYRKRPVALNGLVSWNKSVTHCRPLFPFYTPWKHQRGRSFSVGMERKNWPEMG